MPHPAPPPRRVKLPLARPLGRAPDASLHATCMLHTMGPQHWRIHTTSPRTLDPVTAGQPRVSHPVDAVLVPQNPDSPLVTLTP